MVSLGIGRAWSLNMRSRLSCQRYSSMGSKEFRHVLNSEMARYGELTEEQMYNAVKRHEVYLGRTKCLGGEGSTSTTPPEEYNSTGLQ